MSATYTLEDVIELINKRFDALESKLLENQSAICTAVDSHTATISVLMESIKTEKPKTTRAKATEAAVSAASTSEAVSEGDPAQQSVAQTVASAVKIASPATKKVNDSHFKNVLTMFTNQYKDSSEFRQYWLDNTSGSDNEALAAHYASDAKFAKPKPAYEIVKNNPVLKAKLEAIKKASFDAGVLTLV